MNESGKASPERDKGNMETNKTFSLGDQKGSELAGRTQGEKLIEDMHISSFALRGRNSQRRAEMACLNERVTDE
jgi:hypothetical protein